MCLKNKGVFIECSEERPVKLNPFGTILKDKKGQYLLDTEDDLDFLVLLFF